MCNLFLCTQANITLLEGDCILKVVSRIAGSTEKLELKEKSTDISIYYQSMLIT